VLDSVVAKLGNASMPSSLVAPLISAAVALMIATVSSTLTVLQVRRERRKWLIDTKLSSSMELFKLRISTYPAAFQAIAGLSHGASTAITGDKAGVVAGQLNDWLYSGGGMCASATTRGAILGLRQGCQQWQKSGVKPEGLYTFRNLALAFLRLDLDLEGLEEYKFDDTSTWLKKLERDLQALEARRSSN
jgi:hypothetical protein